MMDAIATLIQRLCACGFLCGVALSLVKHSGQEGILRLCCACLMVVVLFTSLPSLRLETPALGRAEPFAAPGRRGDGTVFGIPKDPDLPGSRSLSGAADRTDGDHLYLLPFLGEIGEDRVFSIRQVTIRSGALLGSQKEAIEQLCRQSLGIGAEQIVWKGEDGDAQDEVGHAGSIRGATWRAV